MSIFRSNMNLRFAVLTPRPATLYGEGLNDLFLAESTLLSTFSSMPGHKSCFGEVRLRSEDGAPEAREWTTSPGFRMG
jgi:hypothetical protein